MWVDMKPLNKMNAELGTKLMVYSTHIRLEHVDAAALVDGEEVSCCTRHRSRRLP